MKGTTRVAYLLGKYAVKLPRVNIWKSFLRGLLANMDERLWYKNSPDEWKAKMCPAIKCYFGGLILIMKRAKQIDIHQFYLIKKADYYPIPMDFKESNFGLYNGKIVLIDYADSRYFCSDCENILKHKTKPI